MTSRYWRVGSEDNGGVHANSGVGNKTAYLIARGGSFNGRTVRGVGELATARIFWRASQLLTSGQNTWTMTPEGEAWNGTVMLGTGFASVPGSDYATEWVGFKWRDESWNGFKWRNGAWADAGYVGFKWRDANWVGFKWRDAGWVGFKWRDAGWASIDWR